MLFCNILDSFHQKLNQGSWCHVFPEGKVWQNWRFRSDNQTRLGEIKIGVGKLIAHCNKSPIIVPIFHRNMDQVMPGAICRK